MKTLKIKLNGHSNIAHGIKLAVTDIRGKTASLSIDAPRHVKILRSELNRFDTPKAAHA